jgi:predicted transport protein
MKEEIKQIREILDRLDEKPMEKECILYLAFDGKNIDFYIRGKGRSLVIALTMAMQEDPNFKDLVEQVIYHYKRVEEQLNKNA